MGKKDQGRTRGVGLPARPSRRIPGQIDIGRRLSGRPHGFLAISTSGETLRPSLGRSGTPPPRPRGGACPPASVGRARRSLQGHPNAPQWPRSGVSAWQGLAGCRPKRQFQKFLQLDKVDLVFTPAALEAASELALSRKTGARALRSIVEEALLEVMYDIPERTDVRRCIITEETIRAGRGPLLLTASEIERGVDETNYEELLRERGASA